MKENMFYDVASQKLLKVFRILYIKYDKKNNL